MAGHKVQMGGYVRVSATDQNEAWRLDALGAVDRLFCEKASGKNTDDRLQLQELLSYVRDGDTVRAHGPGCDCAVGAQDRPWESVRVVKHVRAGILVTDLRPTGIQPSLELFEDPHEEHHIGQLLEDVTKKMWTRQYRSRYLRFLKAARTGP